MGSRRADDMKLTVELDAASSLALRHLAYEVDKEPADAAAMLIQEALLSLGLLETDDEFDEDIETVGEA